MASSAGLSVSVLLLLLCSLPNTALREDTCSIHPRGTFTTEALNRCLYTFSVKCELESEVKNVTATLPVVRSNGNTASSSLCTVRYAEGLCFKTTSAELCPCVHGTNKFRIGSPRFQVMFTGRLKNGSRFESKKDIEIQKSCTRAEVSSKDSSTASPNNVTSTSSNEDQGFLAEAGVALIITICASLATVAIVFFLLVCLCRRRKKTAGVTKRRGADASCNDVIRRNRAPARVPDPSVMIDNCMYGASPPEDYSDVIDRVNPLNSLQTASRYGNKKSEYDEVDILGDYVDVPITCND